MIGRWGHSVVDKLDTIYVFGGKTSNTLLSDFWSYTAKDGWIEIFTEITPSPRAFQDMTTDTDSIYMFGGLNENNCGLDDFWKFNITTQKWSAITQPSNIECINNNGIHQNTNFFWESLGINLLLSIVVTVSGILIFQRIEMYQPPWERHTNESEMPQL